MINPLYRDNHTFLPFEDEPTQEQEDESEHLNNMDQVIGAEEQHQENQ